MQNIHRVMGLLGVVLVVGASILAGCAPPPTSLPTAMPPTLAPTLPAPTPTLMPPTLIPTQAPPALTATSVPPTAAATTDAVALLKTFQDAFNKGDTDGLLVLFVADPSFTLKAGLFGVGFYSGSYVTTQAVRDILEIGFKLNSQLTVSDCRMKNNQATCALVIKDDCNPPTANPYHIQTQFAFMDGKISSVYGRWDVDEENAFNTYNSARHDWARQNLPADEAAYSAYTGPNSTGEGLAGLAPGETASEYGQAVERICKGYTAAGH